VVVQERNEVDAGRLSKGHLRAYNQAMNRTATIAGALLALLLVVAATAIAAPRDRHPAQAPMADESQAEQPQGDDEQEGDEKSDDTAAPSQKLLDRIVANLDAAGITTDAATIAALAETYGVGGAVRLIAWADATGMSTDDLPAMFDSGMGWGEIAQQLNTEDDSRDLRPGIGWIMGNGGNGHAGGNGMGLGRAGAPGQQKKQ
jgi:hypothetical protein